MNVLATIRFTWKCFSSYINLSFLYFFSFAVFQFWTFVSHNQIICVTYVYHLNFSLSIIILRIIYFTRLVHTFKPKINYLKLFNRQFIFVSTNLFSCWYDQCDIAMHECTFNVRPDKANNHDDPKNGDRISNSKRNSFYSKWKKKPKTEWKMNLISLFLLAYLHV